MDRGRAGWTRVRTAIREPASASNRDTPPARERREGSQTTPRKDSA